MLESLTWGDMDTSLRIVEDALRRAMDATRDEYRSWEQDLAPRFEEEHGWDEFSLPEEAIEAMSVEERLAYVAGLLRTMAGLYGVSTDYGARRGERPMLVGEHIPNSPAGLLRGLNDILAFPVADG